MGMSQGVMKLKLLLMLRCTLGCLPCCQPKVQRNIRNLPSEQRSIYTNVSFITPWDVPTRVSYVRPPSR